MQSLSSRHGTSGMRCSDGVGWLTSLLGGGECWLVRDYFWPCYSGIEKEKEREGGRWTSGKESGKENVAKQRVRTEG